MRRTLSRKIALVFAAAAAAVLASAQSKRFELFHDWKRLGQTPMLSPRGEGWESAGTFNPAVMVREGKFVMLYRA